jgi:predicted AlkP superfamily pyrophosphatase or phosphodiesterase
MGVMLTLSCGAHEKKADGPTRTVAIFGVDAMEWSVLEPLVEAGKVPTLAALMQRGSYGYLESMTPTYSPAIWTSIATGKTPDKHGIVHFVYRTGPGESDYRFFTSGHRKTKAFWNIVSDYGRTVGCIGWWMTYPAEHVNGVMVAQTNTTGVLEHNSENAIWKGALLPGVEDQVYPPELAPQVMQTLATTDSSMDSVVTQIFGTIPQPVTEFTKLIWDQSLWSFRADAVYDQVAEKLLASGRHFDVFAVYFSGTDVAGHRFWRYAYPKEFWHPPTDVEVARFGHVIDDYYIHMDRVIGRILSELPDSTTVIVLSDHGMHTVNPDREFHAEDEPGFRLSGNHLDAPPGVFIAAGPDIQKMAWTGTPVLDRLHPIGKMTDILPTVLALEGIPLGKDFDGKPLLNVIDPAFLKRVPLRTVDSHDDRAWEDARQSRMKQAADEAERLEQLKSLGYVK